MPKLDWPRSEPIYEVATERDVMVPMRDGVCLASDIHRPARGGLPVERAFPVLLERTPYNKGDPRRVQQATYFVPRGYVVVFQDCRGRFGSEGHFTKYTADGQDGYDTLAWLARQPWCNAKVGTFGISYGAHTQSALACTTPPALGCMLLDSGGFSSAYHSACRNGGAFELRQVTWAYNQALVSREAQENPVVKAALAAEEIRAWFQRLPWRRGLSPLCWVPDYEEYLLEIWSHEVYDDYWKQVGLCAQEHYGAYSDVPMLHMGSWYDPYARTTTDNFTALSQMKKGPVRLLMGPWTHGQHSVTFAGDVDFGLEAAIEGNLALDYDDLRLRWFDRWLKGLDNGLDREPPVRIFVMGGGSGRTNQEGRLDHGGHWRWEREWPLARTSWAPFHFHPGGSLRPEAPGQAHPPSRYLFDPNHPVPTIGGNISSGLPIMEPGAFDQREGPRFYGSQEPYLPLASRHDVLVFQTPPLSADVEVTGPITVHLWVSSSTPDTDFTAKLLDVYPPSADYPQGFHMNVTDGILRARFRTSWERPEPLGPGQVYRLSIQLYPTSNRFQRGHRIRVDISSSNFPRFDVNPNTGENPALARRRQVAENAVYHDRERPSHILLPIVPE
ncbi:MAG: CocE/NonD family hydrolase [Chloroflexi bacterium]|nr:CocE/NonD family hydrolase [Chloroflexota bacterium]